MVGRLTLYTLTAFLALFAGGTLSSLVWVWGGWNHREEFIVLHRMIIGGAFLALVGLLFLLFVVQRLFVPQRPRLYKRLAGARVHVGLTAWNDEASIGDAVREFKEAPEVHRVVVVDNNSTDGTIAAARAAGADEVVTEYTPGYGACCMRALSEAANGAEVVILCEGDMTFSAADVPKFLAYLENSELVLGTRTTQELRDTDTQMDWLINPGNQILAKLIQARFWGTRLTDVGCTYRAIRAESYEQMKGRLRVTGNHFSPHMYMEALKLRMRVIEIPVVFRKRWGLSKGVGNNKVKAARVALRMLGLLYRI